MSATVYFQECPVTFRPTFIYFYILACIILIVIIHVLPSGLGHCHQTQAMQSDACYNSLQLGRNYEDAKLCFSEDRLCLFTFIYFYIKWVTHEFCDHGNAPVRAFDKGNNAITVRMEC